MANIEMNSYAMEVFSNLQRAFPSSSANIVTPHLTSWAGLCPIGIEVEVKWRDYFPELWERYLKDRPYSHLSQKDKDTLTQECAAVEAFLLPRLEITNACGIDKGADRYWEFAFPPTTNVNVTAAQVELLKRENLIPDGSHSLHLTIGGLHASRHAYYMLLLLEMLSCTPDRVASAYHAENSKLSATWARKGQGGIFQKNASDLKYGYTSAVELRTLVLSDMLDITQLLRVSSSIADTIYDIKFSRISDRTQAWMDFVETTKQILVKAGLSDANWKKPNLTREPWDTYILKYESLRESILIAYFDTFDKVSPGNLTQTDASKLDLSCASV